MHDAASSTNADAEHAVNAAQFVLHLFLISVRTGETCVFLLERRPGVVEFPALSIDPEELSDEEELIRRIAVATGLEVAISGYLSPSSGSLLDPANSKFLIGRVTGGTPHPTLEHVGWEWHPGKNLLTLQFLPKLMVDELRVFMTG
jgi:hypothetical protein